MGASRRRGPGLGAKIVRRIRRKKRLRKAILQQQRLMELLSLPLLKSKPVLMALLMAKRGERRWLRRNLAPAVERRNASDLAPEKEKGLVLGLAVNVLSALA